MTDLPAGGTYDDYADAYAAYAASREQIGDDPMGILPVMLEHLGDLAGCHALDAGCGEGYLARILAGRGARVKAWTSPRGSSVWPDAGIRVAPSTTAWRT